MELTSKLIDNLLSRERIQSQQQQARAREARSFLNESQEHILIIIRECPNIFWNPQVNRGSPIYIFPILFGADLPKLKT